MEGDSLELTDEQKWNIIEKKTKEAILDEDILLWHVSLLYTKNAKKKLWHVIHWTEEDELLAQDEIKILKSYLLNKSDLKNLYLFKYDRQYYFFGCELQLAYFYVKEKMKYGRVGCTVHVGNEKEIPESLRKELVKHIVRNVIYNHMFI